MGTVTHALEGMQRLLIPRALIRFPCYNEEGHNSGKECRTPHQTKREGEALSAYTQLTFQIALQWFTMEVILTAARAHEFFHQQACSQHCAGRIELSSSWFERSNGGRWDEWNKGKGGRPHPDHTSTTSWSLGQPRPVVMDRRMTEASSSRPVTRDEIGHNSTEQCFLLRQYATYCGTWNQGWNITMLTHLPSPNMHYTSTFLYHTCTFSAQEHGVKESQLH